MPSRERIRFVLIVTTAFFFGRFLSALVNPYELDPRLRSELERYKAIPEREVASSTLHGYDPGDQLHQRLGSEIPSSRLQPTVTAVILNWSRFPNVRLISSLLCGPWLDPVIAEVFVWNNNPKRLHTKVRISYDDGADSQSDCEHTSRTLRALVVHDGNYEFTILLPMSTSRPVLSHVRSLRHHIVLFR